MLTLLSNQQIFQQSPLDANSSTVQSNTLTYDQLSRTENAKNPQILSQALEEYSTEDRYEQLLVDLKPYANQSAVSLPEKFSLHRAYIIFRTLGLRHLTVVDENYCVVGVITRKDLMGFAMEEKLSPQLLQSEEESVQQLRTSVRPTREMNFPT